MIPLNTIRLHYTYLYTLHILIYTNDTPYVYTDNTPYTPIHILNTHTSTLRIHTPMARPTYTLTTPPAQSMGSLIRRIYDQIKPTVLHDDWRQTEGLLFVRETLRIKSTVSAAELVLRLEYGAIHWGRVE